MSERDMCRWKWLTYLVESNTTGDVGDLLRQAAAHHDTGLWYRSSLFRVLFQGHQLPERGNEHAELGNANL